MKYIYIAGPLTSDGSIFTDNQRAAIDAAEALRRAGLVPIMTHLNSAWEIVYQHDQGWWLDYCKELIDTCDAVLRLPGKSEGSDIEVCYAEEKGVPVFYSIQELSNARGD